MDPKKSKIVHNAATGSLLGAAMLLCNALPSGAQQTEVAALRAQIEEMTARLEKLEADQKKAADAAAKVTAPTVTSSSKLPVTVSGLLQAHYLAFSGQSNNVAQSPDTFRLRRGEIRLTGAITPRITGTIMIDPAKTLGLVGAPFIGAGAPNQANNPLQEMQLSYLLTKRGAASHFADIGQFKIPVGFEGDLVSSSALQTVERALMFSQRDPFGGGFGDVRESGAQLRGTVGDFDYRLGVFNGLGERQNALALSDPKAILGRLAYHPASIPGLLVGISGGRGNQRTTTGAGVLQRRAERDLFNTFVTYRKAPWTFQTEYLTGDSELQNVVGVPAGGAGLRRRLVQGYYGSVGYLFNPKIEGVLRYDYFNFDRRLGGASARDIVLGVNYFIRGNNAKIQANLIRRNGGNNINPFFGFPGGTINNFQNDRTELRLNFQTGF